VKLESGVKRDRPSERTSIRALGSMLRIGRKPSVEERLKNR